MDTINTVNGLMRIEDLGLIAPHEHVFINISNQYPGKKDIYGIDGDSDKVDIKNLGALRRDCYLIRDNLILDDLDAAIYEMGYLKRAGGNTLVDLTLDGIGRDVLKLKAVSDATGINIIAGCGLYTHDTVSSHLSDKSVDELAELFVRELTEGIGDTGIKAGVIGEIGTSDRIYPVEEKALRAAAMASRATSVPIYVHTYPWGNRGMEVLDIIEEYGVPASRVCICHVDVQFDEDYIVSLLKRGAYIEFDDFGKEFYIIKKPGEFAGGAFATDVERVRMLIKLADMGYEEGVLLANDVCLKILTHSFGGWGYDHVFSNIVPMMQNEGMDEKLIKKLVEINPKCFLSGKRQAE